MSISPEGPPASLAPINEESEKPSSESKETRKVSYSLNELGLPRGFRINGKPSVEGTVHAMVIDEPIKSVMEIVEYGPMEVFDTSRIPSNQPSNENLKSPEVEKSVREITLVITGGGSSPGVGSNCKLAVELQYALQLAMEANSEAQKIKIKRILVVPNGTGIARENVNLAPDGTLKIAGEIAAQALEQVDLKGDVVLMGFSAGGTQSVETIKALEENENITNMDLVLLDPAGTSPISIARMGWNFTVGGLSKAYKKNLRMGRNWKESKNNTFREAKVAFVTDKGRIQRIGHLIKELLNPRYHIESAQGQIAKKDLASPGPIVKTLSKPSTEDSNSAVSGNLLIVDMLDAGVVGNPAKYALENNQFPNAEVTAVSVIGEPAHSSVMTDSILNQPLTAHYEYSKGEDGVIHEKFGRMGSGEQRMNRIDGKGPYSPIMWLVAEWMTKKSS